MSRVPALFLDRDGVINEERSYITAPDQISLITGASAAIRAVNAIGMPVIVITNQSAVARGLISESDLAAIHTHMQALLALEGAYLHDIFYSPFLPDAQDSRYRRISDCRKPGPGMLQTAARKHDLDLSASFLVGDSLRDISAAHAAGLASAYLVLTGHGETEAKRLESEAEADLPHPDAIFSDIGAAVGHLLENLTIHRNK